MKTNLIRTLIFAAASVAAYAQTNMVADVPFGFRAAGEYYTAGAYGISQYGHSGSGILALENKESRLTRFLTTQAPGEEKKGAAPKMVFRCGSESGCALASVELANGRTWKVKVPHLKPSELERIAVVYFDRKQAE
jgi:hypothetical protein